MFRSIRIPIIVFVAVAMMSVGAFASGARVNDSVDRHNHPEHGFFSNTNRVHHQNRSTGRPITERQSARR